MELKKQKFPIWKSRLSSSYIIPSVTVFAQNGRHLHRHLCRQCAALHVSNTYVRMIPHAVPHSLVDIIRHTYPHSVCKCSQMSVSMQNTRGLLDYCGHAANSMQLSALFKTCSVSADCSWWNQMVPCML